MKPRLKFSLFRAWKHIHLFSPIHNPITDDIPHKAPKDSHPSPEASIWCLTLHKFKAKTGRTRFSLIVKSVTETVVGEVVRECTQIESIQALRCQDTGTGSLLCSLHNNEQGSKNGQYNRVSELIFCNLKSVLGYKHLSALSPGVITTKVILQTEHILCQNDKQNQIEISFIIRC